MSAGIKQWQEAEGKTNDEMAALLSERLGRTISPQGYKISAGRRNPPADWLYALGIAPQEPDYPPPSGGNQETPEATLAGRGGAGGGTPPNLPLPFDPAPVQMQITLAYTLAGKGASLALRSPPVAEVWAGAAPGIAAAYVDWAKEDANVARVLNALTLGGPKGVLVTLHATLLINTLIVSGRFNPNRILPPEYREPEETDNLADDGSPVVDLGDNENGNAGDTRASAVPPQGTTRRRKSTARA